MENDPRLKKAWRCIIPYHKKNVKYHNGLHVYHLFDNNKSKNCEYYHTENTKILNHIPFFNEENVNLLSKNWDINKMYVVCIQLNCKNIVSNYFKFYDLDNHLEIISDK